MARRLATAALAALALLVIAAPAQAASCRGKRATHLKFERAPGKQAGMLRWRRPRAAAPGVRYRVYRNRAVVGQTRRQEMRVAVRLGRRYRLTVMPVSARGRLLRCPARLRVRIRYVLPSRPRYLAISDTTRATARLSWAASRAGESPIAGYRVYRAEAVYRQTRGLSLLVRLSSKRRYRFSVAAVDRRGHLSPRSKPVTVVTGHKPPPAPHGLAARDVTDGGLTLSWLQSPPPRGRVVGFRVYRDGTLTGQVKATPHRIDNLAAATDYRFTVRAVDGLGYLSDPGGPLTVSTAMPVPTDGHAHAFLLASTGQSFLDLRAHYGEIGAVYPTYFDCSTGADLTGRDDPLVTGWSRLRHVKVLPRFNCQRSAVLHRIVTEPDLRERWLSQIVDLVLRHGYDGANIDFEAGYASDRDAYSAFVTELASRLHARGKLLSLAVSPKTRDVQNHPRSTFFDYLVLSQHADWIFVMAWGVHWTTSSPGAQDDLPWWTQVADYVATMPNKQRFIMGLQLYGMDWPNGGGSSNPATPYEYADVQGLIARYGGAPTYVASVDAMHYAYVDDAGVHHDLWYSNARTQVTRIRMAADRGIGGVGFWRLGREDPGLWSTPALISPAL